MASLKFRLPFFCEISHFYEILFVKREGSLIFWKKIHQTNSRFDEKLSRDETLTWWHIAINRQRQYTTKFWQLMVMGESVANYSCLFFCVCVFFLVVGYCATTLFVVVRQCSTVDVWLVTLHCRKSLEVCKLVLEDTKWWNNWATSIGRVTKFCEKIVKNQTFCFF